jgi:hypothetical protein
MITIFNDPCVQNKQNERKPWLRREPLAPNLVQAYVKRYRLAPELFNVVVI